MEFRIEKDTLGEVKVAADKYWGAQTERSRMNFRIGPEASMPIEVIRAFALLKKAAAQSNFELGVLDAEKKKLDNGKSTSFIVLRLQRDLTSAKVNEIRALADYNKALTDLHFKEGTILERNKISFDVK